VERLERSRARSVEDSEHGELSRRRRVHERLVPATRSA
jgi:hypothetical protein